ncbi:MAG: DUF11 domain-containing protein [Ardenticatenia bacterium]|nr:DUF11 domain-containing protein [Ardenticatenia bacterium]
MVALSVLLPGMEPTAVTAHNLQTKMVYMFVDPTTQTLLDNRINGGWVPGTPLLQVNDEIGLIIKVVPRDGTTTGVGGHVDFYVPNGVTVTDAAYVLPNGSGGYTEVAMKGQSPIPMGAGPIGAKVKTEMIGLTLGPNINGVTEKTVADGTGLMRGTIAGVYGDTGIFYSTAPDTNYESWVESGGFDQNTGTSDNTITNNSGDVIVPLNKWDAEQLLAWGSKAPGVAIVDTPDQRGNAPWGLASGVAGQDNGYAWDFDWDFWRNSPKTPADMRAASDQYGPWRRLRYPGSRLSKDVAGSSSTVNGFANIDGSTVGVNLKTTDLPPTDPVTGQTDNTSPKALRWAVGQLTQFKPEYVLVKIKVNNTSAILDPSGCPVFDAGTFGGDAGGSDNGKDHLWRYYEPSRVRWNGCAGIGKPSDRIAVKVGDTFQYRVKYYNLGTLTLNNVVIRDTLPSGVTFVSAVPAQTSGPNPLQWTLGTLKPGQKFESLVTVKATGSGLLENCVIVDTNELPDQQSCEATYSGALPFLRQTKSVSPTTVAPGGNVQYTIQVDNIGSGATGNPVTVAEFLPTGFTYVSKDLVTINGANVTATTTVNTGSPYSTNQPFFSVPGAINAGQSLVLKFTALVPAGTPAGNYCNSFTTTESGIPATTGSLGCVDVGGGAIGDRLWRDWDGDGLQDADEEGLAGVVMELQNGVCTPGVNCPTTTTDATGFYQFTGLLAGTYTVKVLSGVPAGYTQTGDPDESGTCVTCNGQSTVTLAFNEKKLDRDFGYDPGGTGSVGDKVFDDKNADGIFNGADAGIPSVTVRLYEDTNGNGVIDVGSDALVGTTASDGSGNYLFSGLATGIKYIADVDQTDADIATYFGAGTIVQTTTDPHNVGTLTGAYTAADFGFYKTVPGSIGDDVFIDADKDGVRDAGEVGIASVSVYLYSDTDGDGEVDVGEPLLQTTTTDANGKYSFGNLPAGNYVVVVDLTDTDIPNHVQSTKSSIATSLTASQQRTDIDFPFVQGLAKTVNLSFANPGNTLNFTLSPYYPGGEILESVRVLDPVPTGVTVTTVGQGGASAAYIQLAGEAGHDDGPPVLDTSITVSPIQVTKGGSISVVMNVQSSTAVTSVSPTGFAVTGGSATCTGPTPASQNVPSGGAPGVNFTWTCTLNDYGEYQFSAEAEDVGLTTIFPGATSASALSHAGGGSNVIQWNLGSITDGTPSQTLTSGDAEGVYGLRGDGQKTFAKYAIGTNSWTAKANTPDNVKQGGALTTDGVDIFALEGNNSQNFKQYTISSNAWSSLANTGTNVGKGGAAVYLNTGTAYIYALMGNGTGFRRYDVGADSWLARAATPANIKKGGALTTDGTYLYALRGDRKNSFYRYDPGANTWSAMANVPANVGWGGSLTRVGGFIYAMRGDNKNNFYRYNIAANTWSSMTNVPGNVKDGGALTTDGTDVYAFRGFTTTFYRYNIAANTWSTRAAFSNNVKQGGALVFVPASGSVARTNTMSAAGTVVTTGMHSQLKMVLTSLTAVTGVAPSALTTNVTSGASASCTGPTPASQTVQAGYVPATFTWDCTMTSGANPGTVSWTASATNGGTTFAAATSNTVIVSPVLTFSGTVNGSPPAEIINTGFLAEVSGQMPVTPSNTTHTATSSTIGDFVWNDFDHDGVQDAGEAGLAGVRVFIDSNNDGDYDVGEPFDTTDGAGGYLLPNLANGTYTVRLDITTLPANYYPTTPTSLSRTITSAGQQITDADFGATQRTGQIGDTLWLDADEDGVLDVGESGIAGVTVNLYRDANNNNAIDSGDYIIGTDVTDSNGNYLFAGLYGGTGGNFLVDVNQATLPGGVELVSPGGRTDPQAVDLTEGESNLTIDFGYNYTGQIGDFAWYDKDGDQVQDGPPEPGCVDTGTNECGAPATTIVLYEDTNNNNQIDPGEPIVAVTVTDSDGAYLFDNLPPGNYVVKADTQQVPAPASSANAGQVGLMNSTTGSSKAVDLTVGNMTNYTADFGFIEAAKIEGHVFHDIDHNGLLDSGETLLPNVTVTLTGTDISGNPVSLSTTTDASGAYKFLVSPGTYTIAYNTADPDIPANLTEPTTAIAFTSLTVIAGAEYQDLDFGLDDPGKIGDRVWKDDDADGVQDGGEIGLGGVTVRLYADNNNNGVVDGGDTLLASQATAAGTGAYLFEGLPTGGSAHYVVQVDSTTIPAGYVQKGDPDQAGVCTVCDHQGNADLPTTTPLLTLDFGYQPPALSVSGNLWKDNDGDGVDDGAGEPGIPGVTMIVAIDTNGDGITDLTLTAVTDASGNYSVTGIPNGSNVTITVDETTLPNDAYNQTGDEDEVGTCSVCDAKTVITNVTVNQTGKDFGYQEALGSISGTVVENADGDGLAEGGETPVPGVLVILIDAGPDQVIGTLDDIVTTTTTNVSGDYSFPNLTPGVYQISKINPPGKDSLADRDGANPDQIGVTLTLAQAKVDQDFELQGRGVIGDFVWADADRDGLQDSGEPGIPNVTLNLYRDDGDGIYEPGTGDSLVATTVTDGDGAYLFDSLGAGSFWVGVATATLPTGYVAQYDEDDGTTAPDNYSLVNLPSGFDHLTADFGYGPADTGNSSLLGDRVWYDADGDGEQDDGEVGIAGVTVRVTPPAGVDIGAGPGNPVNVVTAADGSWQVAGLPAGSYTVAVLTGTLPAGLGTTPTNGTISRILTVPANTAVLYADFGFNGGTFGSIGNTLWLDVDGDGVGPTINGESHGAAGTPDNNEPPIAGISVSLIQDVNNDGIWDPDGVDNIAGNGDDERIIATDVTDAVGQYKFVGVPITDGTGTDDFLVLVGDRDDLLSDMTGTYDADGTSGGGGANQANSVLGLSRVQDLSAASRTDQDFGFTPPGGWIGNLVWHDLNNDGRYGVQVIDGKLDINGDGVISAADDGVYAHANVIDGQLDINRNGSIEAGDGYLLDGRPVINGLIDFDGNGTVNAADDGRLSEPTLQGVAMELYYDADGSGTINGGDVSLGTATTDVAGYYVFTGLPTNSTKYLVRPAASNTVPGGVLEAMTKTTGSAGLDNNSQASPYPVTLTGVAPTSITADFGYRASTPFSISGTTFLDKNNNGGTVPTIEAGTDDILSYIPVYLYNDLDGDGLLEPGEPLIASTISSAAGYYRFTDLPPGDYIITTEAMQAFPNGFFQTTQQGTNAVEPVTILNTNVIDQDFGFYDNGGSQTTPVTLSSFRAERAGDTVRFSWTTATETGNIGFNLYVQTDAGLRRVNAKMIPSEQVDSLSRTAYAFEAKGVQGDRFVIEDVDLRGKVRKHGTFEANVAYGSTEEEASIDWDAIHAEDERLTVARDAEASADTAERIVEIVAAGGDESGDADAETDASDPSAAGSETDAGDATSATDASGAQQDASTLAAALAPAVARFSVKADGMVRVTYEQLLAAGIDLKAVVSSQLALVNRGRPVPVQVTSAARTFGAGSTIEFYGEAVKGQYTRSNVYDLVVNSALRQSIGVFKTAKKLSGTPAASYVETLTVDNNRAYGNTSPSDDPWYDMRMLVFGGPGSWTVPVTVDSVAPGTGTLTVKTWGGTDWDGDDDHHLQAAFNGTAIVDGRFDGLTVYEPQVTLPSGLLREGANTLGLTLPGDNGFDFDLVNFDRLELKYPRAFVARGGKLSFTAAAPVFTVSKLSSANVVVYRFADGAMPVRYDKVAATRQPDGSYTAMFEGQSRAARYEVLSVAPAGAAAIAAVRRAADITAAATDYVVIAHPNFIAGIQPLVDFHRGRGLRVKVVDVRDVYDRYSFGIFDPLAIKAYIKDAKANGVRFALLVGGDTYDYLNYANPGAMSFIPTLYARTDPIIHFAPVDPQLADVDNDGTPDVAIGRFPVRTTAELSSMVAKTLAYAGKSYAKTAVFAADEVDPLVDFTADSEAMIGLLPGGWDVQRAHIDQVGVSEARTRLLARLNQGVALASFIGHSSATAWTFSGLLRSSDAAALTNAGKPTVVAQWGCWNTYFVSPSTNTLGPAFLLSGDRGAAAVLGASTLTEARSEELLGGLVLPRLTTPGATIGEAVLAAKRELARTNPDLADVLLGWTVLGDPALQVER